MTLNFLSIVEQLMLNLACFGQTAWKGDLEEFYPQFPEYCGTANAELSMFWTNCMEGGLGRI